MGAIYIEGHIVFMHFINRKMHNIALQYISNMYLFLLKNAANFLI